jgi:hypothetical protein
LWSTDSVTTKDGGWSQVGEVTKTGRHATVYNFEVEGFHTYFVGEQGALVHNSCTAGVTTRALTEADLGLRAGSLVKSEGAVTTAGGVKILRIDYIEGNVGMQARNALSNMIASARAEGVSVLQIEATFANGSLEQFVYNQVSKVKGMISSSNGRDVITILIGKQ